MMMGLETLFMMMSSNVMLLALPVGDPGHVLIRSPFVVPETVQFFTVSPTTSFSFAYLPRLPTLKQGTNLVPTTMSSRKYIHAFLPELHLLYVNAYLYIYLHTHTNTSIEIETVVYLRPWPGPQKMREMETLVTPGPTEMQSSPVLMCKSVMLTWSELLMWTPSVLGLSAGAVMLRPWTVMELHQCKLMWKPLLFTRERRETVALFTSANVSVCMPHTGLIRPIEASLVIMHGKEIEACVERLTVGRSWPWPQHLDPWPSNVPPPPTTSSWSMWNLIQHQVWKLGSAFTVPLISTAGDVGLLQGPLNTTGPKRKVPGGITKVAFPAYPHASCQAARKACKFD